MTPGTSERALPLVAEIYSAALDPVRWAEFLRLLADDLGCAAIGLTLEIPNIAESRLVFRHNLDPRYNELGHRLYAESLVRSLREHDLLPTPLP